MSFDFQDRVALVTGGASGIGRAAALAFASNGARVLIADLNDDGGEETVESILATGGTAAYTHADMTDMAAVDHMVDTTVETFGQLDFALNNAGVAGIRAPLHEYPDDEFVRVMEINVAGVWHCMKAEIVVMLAQGHGVIVNLASVAGLLGSPRLSAYAASKHAVVGLTKTAALEYIRKGIRINAVCPAYTETPMVQRGRDADPHFAAQLENWIPARRLGTVEEIAAAVMYLCSDEAGFITGHTLTLDGGISAG